MQWIALDENRHPITACRALKQTRYACPECSGFVQLRSGPHRKAHFYHMRAASLCAQHKKTEEHFGLQLLLASRIPDNKAQIERAFPEIGRIADVAWETRKIVFEIQCSPISLQEVQTRCLDYCSIGWDILWILSDKRFNKKRLGAAEAFLRLQTSYYSHWDEKLLYDQREVLHHFHRIYKSPRVAINPVELAAHSPQDTPACALPPSLQQRWDSWKWRADKDILSQILLEEPIWLSTFKELEKRMQIQKTACQRLPWGILLKQLYIKSFKKLFRYIPK
jgi:competence protein CoiA